MEKQEPLKLLDVLHHAETFYEEEPGSIWDAANSTFDKMAKKAQATHKKTSVTITIDFIPTKGKGDLQIVGKVDGKEPAHIPLPLTVFTDSRGRIFAEDTRQLVFSKDDAEETEELPSNVHPISIAKGA